MSGREDERVIVHDKTAVDVGSPGGSSSGSGSSSTGDEERLRRLFKSCDEDGDGFLDGDDLATMCRLLGMEECTDDVIRQLGADRHHKISWQDFIDCRSQLMSEIEHEKQTTTKAWRTSSENSLSSLPKPDSLDYDSGARDMSPEPNLRFIDSQANQADPSYQYDIHGGHAMIDHRHTMIDPHVNQSESPSRYDVGGRSTMIDHRPTAMDQAGRTQFLPVSNELHTSSSVPTRRNDFNDLAQKLHRVTSERDILDRQLNKSQTDKYSLIKDYEEKIHDHSLAYEERITELHGVIAELRRKIERQTINIIKEEDEEDDNNASCHSNSAVAGEVVDTMDISSDLNADLCRVARDLDPDKHHVTTFDNRQSRPDIMPYNTDSDNDKTLQMFRNMEELRLRPDDLNDQMYTLQVDNTTLREQMANQETELNKTRAQLGGLQDDRDTLKRKVAELQSRLHIAESSPQGSRVSTPTKNNPPLFVSDINESTATVSKMAGLKRLKTGVNNDNKVLGAEISTIGVQNTKVAEYLAQNLHDCSNMTEILQTLENCGDSSISDKIKEFEIEISRLTSKIGHLKGQNDVITRTLDESKGHCDRLYLLIGRYESNITALKLIVDITDQIVDVYQALMDVGESDRNVLLANCRAAGIGGASALYSSTDSCYGSSPRDSHDEVSAILENSHDAKKNAEYNARRVLNRLDRKGGTCTTSSSGTSSQWGDMSSRTNSTNSSTGSSDLEFTKMDEERLRELVLQLRQERDIIQNTVTDLESINTDPFAMIEPRASPDSQRLDLENAVLIEELMAIKEEKAELNAQNYILERENQSLLLRISGKESQEQVYRVQIEHLQSEVHEQQQLMSKETSHKIDTPTSTPAITLAELRSHDPSQVSQDLSESLKREKRLKMRVQELVVTLEKLSKNSEIRHQQSAEFVNDLKKANSALVAAFEKAKRKYQSKINKLEKQLQEIQKKHQTEIAPLRQRLSSLEGAMSGETSL